MRRVRANISTECIAVRDTISVEEKKNMISPVITVIECEDVEGNSAGLLVCIGAAVCGLIG